MAPDSFSDLLACVAAFGRSLDERLDPARFLAEFSGRTQRLVPHDCMSLRSGRTTGRRTRSSPSMPCAAAFAATTDGTPRPSSAVVEVATETFALAPVFRGETQLIVDMATDDSFGEGTACQAQLGEAGLRARLAVPLFAAGA
jgi:hypothetical protein